MALARILVADDDRVTSRFVSSLLEGEGYEVLVADDGEHALELALEHTPDLIVSDLIMPYRDGFEVLRALRSEDRLARVPVVILSMKDREEDIVRGLEEGADDYVVKPFNARELVVRVRKLLQRSRGKH
jgi:DNA-binding response OmpR family regulator